MHIVISHIRYCKSIHCPACENALATLLVSPLPLLIPRTTASRPPRYACCRLFFPSLPSRSPPSPPPSSSPWPPGGVPALSKPNCFASSASSTRRSNAFFSLQPSYACFFLHEVDPSAEGCADYYRVILDEMDLDKMTAKANRGEYKTIELFKHDFDDMIENCRVYNRVGHGRFLHRRRWRACWPTLRPSRRSSRRSTNC